MKTATKRAVRPARPASPRAVSSIERIAKPRNIAELRHALRMLLTDLFAEWGVIDAVDNLIEFERGGATPINADFRGRKNNQKSDERQGQR